MPDLEPRIWAVPDDPGDDVTAVIDDDGDRWERTTDGEWVCEEAGSGTLYWGSLLADFGPLTDATHQPVATDG